MSLRDQIEREIRERGPMPFSRYMELCLFHPSEGYYSRSSEQFGKAGDFYTSSDVHAVFGRLLARQFEEMWQALDRTPRLEILEVGPGRGLFARDVLDWSRKKFPAFFEAVRYTLQESSSALRAKLQQTMGDHLASGHAAITGGGAGEGQATSVRHLNGQKAEKGDQVAEGKSNLGTMENLQRPEIHRACPPETPLIVFANEFFDALPVEILGVQGKLHLAFENGRLAEIWRAPSAEDLEFLDRYGVHPEQGERIEAPLVAQHWMSAIASIIRRGFFVVVDYGYTRSEQLAGRHRGTLMAYRRHSASVNPYQAPGEQDLTAHVNFTALATAAERAGMIAEKLVTQSQFLMGIGEKNEFADAFGGCRLPQERAKVALQLKHLITPAGMGESFQVLVASRGVEPGKVAVLSGLRFGTIGKDAGD